MDQMKGRPATQIEVEAMQAIANLQDEVQKSKTQLSEAKKVIRVVVKIVDSGELYDDDEGDCMYCRAEAYEDGYHHAPSCRAAQLEKALEAYRKTL